MRMAHLTVVARIEAKDHCIDMVKAELLKLTAPTRQEAGCIQYDLHQDNENPAAFLVYETWENRELWQEHMESPHLAAFLQATDGAIRAFTVNEMMKL